ncbi:MAG: DsbA family protein [Ferruginibacter sp.]
MKPLLIYCYDAYCSWCYGFSPVLRLLSDRYADVLTFEVLSASMISDENPTPIQLVSPFLLKTYKEVEEKTGIRFGPDFLWHIENPHQSDWAIHSTKAAIALCVLKELRPEETLNLAADLQTALFAEGRDLTDHEAYRHLLARYSIDPTFFYKELESIEYKIMAAVEEGMIKNFKVGAFPTLILQTGETDFFLISQGIDSYEDISARLDDLLSTTRE